MLFGRAFEQAVAAYFQRNLGLVELEVDNLPRFPIIEQAIETAALMLGTDKSRGYCLEMICADFLAGASLESEDSSVLLQSMSRFFKFLPGEHRQAFLKEVSEQAA